MNLLMSPGPHNLTRLAAVIGLTHDLCPQDPGFVERGRSRRHGIIINGTKENTSRVCHQIARDAFEQHDFLAMRHVLESDRRVSNRRGGDQSLTFPVKMCVAKSGNRLRAASASAGFSSSPNKSRS